MAVRGLGCPVRFSLTAGHGGDAPQAEPLIEGLAADVVMADTAYDSDRLRRQIDQKGAVAVIPNNPARALKHPPAFAAAGGGTYGAAVLIEQPTFSRATAG